MRVIRTIPPFKAPITNDKDKGALPSMTTCVLRGTSDTPPPPPPPPLPPPPPPPPSTAASLEVEDSSPEENVVKYSDSLVKLFYHLKSVDKERTE
jgi:hypothetical protein